MVRLAGTIHQYTGFSWETKPYVGQRRLEDDYVLTAADLPIGSTFLTEDGGGQFVYNGETWEPDVTTALSDRIVAALGPLISLLEESRKQTGLLEQIVSDIPEGEGA